MSEEIVMHATFRGFESKLRIDPRRPDALNIVMSWARIAMQSACALDDAIGHDADVTLGEALVDLAKIAPIGKHQ